MPHLNLDLDYFEHRKTKRLVGLLGRGAEVLPVKLWRYCGKYHCEDGRLAGYTDQEIESIVEWWGKPGECIRALLSVGFIEMDDATFVAHNWIKVQGHIPALKARNTANALKRWAKVRDACQTDATGMRGQCPLPSKPSKPSATGDPPGPEPNPKAEYRQFTDYFCQRWKETNGGKYHFDNAEGVFASRIWVKVGNDLAAAKVLVDRYLADTTDFYQGHKLSKLASDVPRFQTNRGRNGSASVPLQKTVVYDR
jgi:hypothetical protein